MRRASIALAVLTPLLLAFASQTGTNTLSGTVVRADTREAVAGARVLLKKSDGRVSAIQVTDTDGKFVFRNLEKLAYDVSAQLAGLSMHSQNQGVWPSDGTSTQSETIWLFPTGTISRRITLEQNGQPVPDLAVRILYRHYDSEGLLQLTDIPAAFSDREGNYVVKNVPAGQYEVATAAAGANAANIYLPRFYPGTNDEPAAAKMTMTDGQQLRNIDFAVTPAHLVNIHGHVVDALLRRLPHLDWISLRPRFSPGSAERIQFRNEEAFDLPNVLPGMYYLLVFRLDDEDRAEGLTVLNVGGTDISDATVASIGECHIMARLKIEGTPDLKAFPAVFPVRLRRDEDRAGAFVEGGELPRDGKFKTLSMACGLQRITFPQPVSGYYVKSAVAGARDVLHDGLKLPVAVETLEVTLAHDGASITGAVSTKEPTGPRAVSVVLIPDKRTPLRPELYKVARPDGSGHFAISDIAPGDYTIYAWSDIEAHSFFDPDFIARFQGKGVAVHLGPSGSTQLNLSATAAIP